MTVCTPIAGPLDTRYSRLTGAVYLRWTEGKPRTLIALCVSITAGPVAHSVREDGLDASPLVLGELDLVIPGSRGFN